MKISVPADAVAEPPASPERFPRRGSGTPKTSPCDLDILARAQQAGLVDARAPVVASGVSLFLKLEEESSSLSHVRISGHEVHQGTPLDVGLGRRCSGIVPQHLCALLDHVSRRRDVRVAPRPTNMGVASSGADRRRCSTASAVMSWNREAGVAGPAAPSVGGAPSWGLLLEPSRAPPVPVAPRRTAGRDGHVQRAAPEAVEPLRDRPARRGGRWRGPTASRHRREHARGWPAGAGLRDRRRRR
jgi:hypothetical protein